MLNHLFMKIVTHIFGYEMCSMPNIFGFKILMNPYCWVSLSIAEKCFDIWGILKMASVKPVESGNNCFSLNHIIRCRSKFLPLGFSNLSWF